MKINAAPFGVGTTTESYFSFKNKLPNHPISPDTQYVDLEPICEALIVAMLLSKHKETTARKLEQI